MVKPDELIARADTSIGHLELLRREVQAEPGTFFIELLIDGRTLMSDFNTVSERALAREGVARCVGSSLRVLVGGLGLGHTADAALSSSRVAAVDVVEFVPQVAEWFREGLMPLSKKLWRDSRFSVIEDDVFERLSKPPVERYDLILIDVDHSPDDPLTWDSESFYTVKGLLRVREHLAPGGVLAVWSCRNNEPFAHNLRRVFARVGIETTLFQDDLFGEEDEINYMFFGSEPLAVPSKSIRPQRR